MAFSNLVIVSACIVLCTAQPVQKSAPPVLKDTETEVLFKDGERAVLECAVDGGQNVKYTWRKNDQPFTPSGNVIQRNNEGTLEFQKPTSSDEGLYICNAETSHGTATTRGTGLKRAFIDTPKVTVQKHKAVAGRPFNLPILAHWSVRPTKHIFVIILMQVKLDCKAPNSYPKPTISWKTQEDGSDKIEDYLNRRITPSPDGTLWFSNVTQEDANPKLKYICVAKSPAFEEVRLAEHYINELEVDSKPNNGDLVPQYVSDDIVAKVGDVTMIWCIYGGTPLARPDWFKDGKNVNGDENPGSQRVTRHNRTSGRRLLIKQTLAEDEGVYKCVANNEVGKPEEHSMKLSVVSTPTLAKKLEKQTFAKEGQDITIPCQSTGNPQPTTAYTFNGQELKTSDRVSTSPEGISIKKAQKNDGGYYGCKVVSQYGSDYQETLLHFA